MAENVDAARLLMNELQGGKPADDVSLLAAEMKAQMKEKIAAREAAEALTASEAAEAPEKAEAPEAAEALAASEPAELASSQSEPQAKPGEDVE